MADTRNHLNVPESLTYANVIWISFSTLEAGETLLLPLFSFSGTVQE